MTCKTNIVLLTDCLGNITGGAEKQIFELAKRLPKDQYNVFVASMEATGETSKPLIESIGCQLQVFRIKRIYGLSGMIQGFKFFSFLRQNSVDVLMTYHFGSDIWGTFWGHLAGVRTIISNRRDMGFWRNQSHVMTYKLFNRWVNKIITVSSCIKQMVIQTEGVPAGKLEVIYNGVDVLQGSINVLEKKTVLGIGPSDIVVMHVANLRPVKGHKYLLEAFAKAAGQSNKAKLILIGKDELKGELQNLAQNLNIKDKVLFLGQRTDVAELLPIADICVLPSLSEGMSNAILEYMAFGKPVIATHVGGNPELITNGFNGFLVEKEDAEQLREVLLKLLQDKEKCQIMGQNGLSRVKTEFSMETMMAHYERLFKDKIKVLHLVSSGGLFGAERVILTLASQKGNVDFWVGALNNYHNPHLEIIQEAQNIGLKTVIFDSRSQVDFKTLSSVREFLDENRIDILHTHNFKSDIVGFWATRFSNVQWVSTNHLWHGTDSKLRFYEIIDAFVLKFAKMIFAVSQEIKDDMLNKGFKEDHVHVIYNGINISQFSPKSSKSQLRAEWKVSDNEVLLAIVGRLAPEKGHEVLFKALNMDVKGYPFVKCLVVGDGPLKNDLELMVKDLNLSNHVIFAGIRKDMPAVYSACDIMVNASSMEGLPMTILEAMASRLPIIATRVGAVGQVIKNEENGILLESGDPVALSKAIMVLVKDADKRKALAQQAYKDVSEHFSQQRLVENYENFYQGLVK